MFLFIVLLIRFAKF